jgi:hypothetical protein
MPSAGELARHVNAFFPPMYTFDDDRQAWAKRAEAEAAEDRVLAPGKPVFFYLWPQYHDGTPKQFQYVVEPSGNSNSIPGVALPRVSCCGLQAVSTGTSSGWWAATQEFMRLLHARIASDTDNPIRLTESFSLSSSSQTAPRP